MAIEVARLTIGNEVRWQAMNFHDPMPGESAAHQAIHADRSFFPNCTGYMNVCWAFDDMTVENGATRIVPGSHKGPWPRDVLNDKETCGVIDGEIYTECPAGTAIFTHGDVWHGGRANYSQSTRRALHLGFACVNTAPQSEMESASCRLRIICPAPMPNISVCKYCRTSRAFRINLSIYNATGFFII
jgi:ectoine hydroxylase-related dioxygenase (phytanoyl-CoA dioxygenase family)